MSEFDRLNEIMAKLRSDEGCPWDKEQTYETLIPYLLEEAHEVYEAILEKDTDGLQEELGDLMLHVVFLSQIAKEEGKFTSEDVARGINEKLIRRHPHVFGKSDATTTNEVLQSWEEIKKKEKEGTTKERKSLLQGVPKTLPALTEAYKLRGKAARVGFDFPNVHEAFMKAKEEMDELEESLGQDDINHIEKELGDLLFTVVNVAAKTGLDPETALKKTNKKFRRRFGYIEEKSKEDGKDISRLSLDEMDEYWNRCKSTER